jgi:hypothetical protein
MELPDPSVPGVEASPSELFAPGPVGLWTMINDGRVAELAMAMRLLERARAYCDRRQRELELTGFPSPNPLRALAPEDLGFLMEAVRVASEDFSRLRLRAALGQVETVQRGIKYNVDLPEMASRLRHLGEIAAKELDSHVFLYIPEDMAVYLKDPEGVFAGSFNAFPSAQSNMREACACFACGRFPATLYHCMLVVQEGLFRLAARLTIKSERPPYKRLTAAEIRREDWQPLLRMVRARLKEETQALANQARRKKGRDEDLEFYQEAHAMLDAFKDVWRNPVAHGRQNRRDRPAAAMILARTVELMAHLAPRLGRHRGANEE